MGKNIKKYFETDEHGKHEIIEQSNGVRVKVLIEPSESYLKKKAKTQEEYQKQKLEKDKIKDREKLIQEKMRSLAITELEKEGKI